ncbi:MAG TPA: molybdopterin-dependent oxidoreductase [Steroidobacteraceae bacterium]|jgi:anaerobic selenocysteine-containing dehydrogenase|nr:molybdopterin-dependent oxidoreductase [Steroidobacteraceae bacterium]
MNESRDDVVLTTCPRDCYDTCGMLVHRRDGIVTAVRGNPAHAVSRGTLCGKCSTAYNREWRDPARRLTLPLRRVGAKGAGRFEPIAWDTACAEIAQRLRRIVASQGAQTILNAHYTGTISLLAGVAPMRFFHRLGATEITPDTICNMAGHVALRYLYGSSVDGFDPRTAQDAACIVVWGANPHASAPHAHENWLPEACGKVVVVDPIRTPTAAQADIHLQPFPGSDAALAFALLHVIRREGLIDSGFIAAHVQGWEELEPLLGACDPAWGAAVTGVPAALIEEVAVLYARGPSLLWLGQGLQRQTTGGNVMRACGLLPAVTGNLCKPGAGFLYLNGNLRQRRMDEEYLSGAHLAPGGGAPSVSHMDFAAALEDPARSQALFVWNMNPLASCPQQARLRRALQREDLLTIALDLFPTDTTGMADYVLPAASFLEFDDLIASYFQLTLSAQVKAMEPMGSALPNQEIFRRLGQAMEFSEPELQESDAAILDTLMERSGLGLTFAALAKRGSIWVPEKPAVQFVDGVFATPSGRIEIASARAAADGHPRVPQAWSDPRPAAGHLRLLSPAHAWLMNTTFGNVRQIEKRIGDAAIALHPGDAADRGLAEGDSALVHNSCGSLRLTVAISDEVPRGVALTHKGRWLSTDAAGANVNVLNPGEKSDMGESTAVHSIEVSVSAI